MKLLTEKEINQLRKKKASIPFSTEISRSFKLYFNTVKLGDIVSVTIKERGQNGDETRKCNKYYDNEYLNYKVVFKNAHYFQIFKNDLRISIMLNDLIDGGVKILK